MLLNAYYSQNYASIMCQGLVLVLNRFAKFRIYTMGAVVNQL